MDRDIINMLPIKMVANDTFALIDRMQDMKRESAMIAVFAAASLMAERFDVPPSLAGAVADRVMETAEGRRPEFAAARAFLEEWE